MTDAASLAHTHTACAQRPSTASLAHAHSVLPEVMLRLCAPPGACFGCVLSRMSAAQLRDADAALVEALELDEAPVGSGSWY